MSDLTVVIPPERPQQLEVVEHSKFNSSDQPTYSVMNGRGREAIVMGGEYAPLECHECHAWCKHVDAVLAFKHTARTSRIVNVGGA